MEKNLGMFFKVKVRYTVEEDDNRKAIYEANYTLEGKTFKVKKVFDKQGREEIELFAHIVKDQIARKIYPQYFKVVIKKKPTPTPEPKYKAKPKSKAKSKAPKKKKLFAKKKK